MEKIMETHNAIESDKRKGNLHISLGGEFSHDTAMAVTYHIANKYSGKGNIFIHTKNITEIAPRSQVIFNYMVDILDLPKEKIYLMGEKGKDICHDKGRVIITPEKKHGSGCCGKCKNCTCTTQKEH